MADQNILDDIIKNIGDDPSLAEHDKNTVLNNHQLKLVGFD